MSSGDSASVLEKLGFHQVGHLNARLDIEVWWHKVKKLQILVCRLGTSAIVRGSKHYFVRAVSAEGETWARDVGLLQDYLEGHFPEFRLSFSFFRDISGRLAAQHIRHKAAVETPSLVFPTADDLARLQAALEHSRREEHALTELAEIPDLAAVILKPHLQKSAQDHRRRAEEYAERLEEARRKAQTFDALHRQYLRNGSAASFVFSLCSAVHVTTCTQEFADAVSSTVKELEDADRYEVSQKLGQGRLNIQVSAAEDPSWAWIEEWLGGALTPRQLQKLEGPWAPLRNDAERHLMVTADEDIVVDGHVKEDQKLLAARVLSTLVTRMDGPDAQAVEERDVDPVDLPAFVGQHVQGGRASEPCLLPLAHLDHLAASGSTGAGKSVFVRVLTEEAAQHKVNVLVLDPRNQAAGLLVPEDREEFLALYAAFGLQRKDARAFPFSYHAPGEAVGSPLPADLSGLAQGLHVVSFKGLSEEDRCTLFASILDAVFLVCAREESPSLQQLVVVEEAQLFTRRRVGPEARAAGSSAENALDRIVREGRKYGLCAVIASQSIKDFSHDVASIRQNTNTKVFFRNADREVEYAADFLGDGRKIIGLPPGTCIVHNASLGLLTIKVRPPFSKLWEFSAADTRKLLQPGAREAAASVEAQRLLEIIRHHHAEQGCGLNLSDLADRVGITSKRRLQDLIDELEGCGAVRTKKLRERGQPRIVEPVASGPSAGEADESRTEAD